MKFAYYPGCSPKSTTSELDHATRALAERLEIELVELEGASCCGTVEIRSRNLDLFIALNARTLAMAEQQGLDMITICDTCQLNLAHTNKQLKEDQGLLDKTNERLSALNLRYGGSIEVRHFLWVLLHDIGPQRLKDKVARPLSSLRVAPFYGCHILRPKEVLGFDDPDRPSSLESLIQICGAEPVDYLGKTKCCGFHNLPYDQNLALELTAKYLMEAKEKGAHSLVTPCPLCFTMLDGYQRKAEKHIKTRLDLPVFHMPQLLGLALGMGGKELMLRRNIVSPTRILRKLGHG
jgi:succinate dehydrogenase / fumarate reductase cytochrome b subunit